MKNYDFLSILQFLFTFIVTIVVLLMVVGVIVPPPGVIDSSVLRACGILWSFALLTQLPILINNARKVNFSKGDSNLSIDMDEKIVIDSDIDDLINKQINKK